MYINIFNDLLENVHNHGVEEHEDDWEGLVEDKFQFLRNEYGNLRNVNRIAIDYSAPETQAAYIYAFGLARAGFTFEHLKRHHEHDRELLFSSRTPNVACFGGGPGSEIAGILKYAADPHNTENIESVNFTVFDRVDEWHSVNELLAECAQQHSDIEINIRFQELDLLDSAAVQAVDMSEFDLATFSYVISELVSFKATHPVVQNLQALFSSMSRGSHIFYMDSASIQFYSVMNEARRLPRLAQRSDIEQTTVLNLRNLPAMLQQYDDQFGEFMRPNGEIVSKLIKVT